MPRISARQAALRNLEDQIFGRLLARALTGRDPVENLHRSSEMQAYVKLSNSRYLNRSSKVKKSRIDEQDLINQLENGQLTDVVRMSRESFLALYDLIKDDAIYKHNPRRPQTHVKVQMMIALEDLGRYRTSNSQGRLAKESGICANSVVTFTKRFMDAIASLERDFLFWPDERERKEISARIEQSTGFPSCIGVVDGLLIPFTCKPAWNPDKFYKKDTGEFGLNSMIVCDDQKFIRYCCTSSFGDTTDAQVYAESDITPSFFSSDEYLVSDAQYTPSKEIVPAYEGEDLDGENIKFNQLHEKLRARVDECIETLKSRFQCLKAHRTLIRDATTHEQVLPYLKTTCILHNFLLMQGDPWTE